MARRNTKLMKKKIEDLTRIANVMSIGAIVFGVSLMLGYLTVSSNQPTGQMNYVKTQMDQRELVPSELPNAPDPSLGRSTTSTSPTRSSSAGRTAPQAGVPENLIIAGSILLGLIGSASYIALKRGV